MDIIRGRVWKLGDNISTDLLMPTFTMYGKMTKEEMPKYCLHAERPEFAKEVKKNDIIIAGKNFGCGSSRPAASNLVALGVGCVVVESSGALFFRNSISIGLPIMICPGITELFEDGEEGEINLATGEIKNLKTGRKSQAAPYPPFLLAIIREGGILPLWRQGKRISEMK
jgi:3-isopropylmalate/(R)-2-methylmalate dehydratase small subunit